MIQHEVGAATTANGAALNDAFLIDLRQQEDNAKKCARASIYSARQNDTPVLPSEPEIERIILGALLLREDSAQVAKLRRDLHSADFTMPSNREIFECLGEMSERGDPINIVLLLHRLRAVGSTVDAATIAALIDGVPRYSDLSTEIRILKDVTARREIIRCADAWYTEAQARDVNVADLTRTITSRAAEFGRSGTGPAKVLATNWGALCDLKIERGEAILHEVERGEVVMCASITNRGKTTFWRNVALSLASGQEFAPIVKGDKPRVALYLDFETRLWRLRADITKMLGQLQQRERALVAENLHIIADCRINDRPFTLSNPRHLEILEEEARRIKADVIIVDTLTAAFEIENENDNAEGSRIMKKLTGLAQRLHCVVVFLHHIGKAKQEEGQTVQIVHRGRGGSSYSGFSHAIFNLTADPILRERVTLECAKIKGERFDDTVLNLDQATRWFAAGGAVVKPVSPYEQVISVFNGQPLKRAEVLKLLPNFKAASLDRHLRKAVEDGDLAKLDGGAYQKTPKPHPYRDDKNGVFAETVEEVEDKPDFGDTDVSGDGGARNSGYIPIQKADREVYFV